MLIQMRRHWQHFLMNNFLNNHFRNFIFACQFLEVRLSLAVFAHWMIASFSPGTRRASGCSKV